MTKKDIITLENVDEELLRELLQAHLKIPIDALFLETKAVPLCYIVARCRIMYLHNILQKDKNEIVHRVIEAQKSDPNPGDFVLLMKEDCEGIGLIMSEKEI